MQESWEFNNTYESVMVSMTWLKVSMTWTKMTEMTENEVKVLKMELNEAK